MSYIDLTDPAYSNLSQMAVYAQGDLTATTTGSSSIVVNTGYWAGSLVTEYPALALQGSPGLQNDSVFLANCESELITLLINIGNLRDSLPPKEAYNVIYFTPGYYTTNNTIIYDTTNITFDAEFNPNAQFLIYANDMTFKNTTFNLINGARAGNIFWIATFTTSSDITITNDNFSSVDMIVPGIIITYNFTATNSGAHPLVINGLITDSLF